MTIAAILPWFGSKRLMAADIIRELGPHQSYWEPFCGSLAVLLAKPESSHEHACDLHGDLINLARVLQDEGLAVALYGRLSRTLFHEDLFAECRDWWSSRPDVPEGVVDPERAYRYFVVSWMGRNGVSGTARVNHTFAVRWTSGGAHGGGRFRSAVESIPDWHHRLRRVVILRRDSLKVLGEVEDQVGTAIYADPPYFVETRAKSGGGGNYQHDFADTEHAQLAEMLRRFRQARVVLSYYADDRLARLYPDWTLLDCGRNKQLSVHGRRGSEAQTAPEVLLLNGPAVGGREGLFQ